jgi:putative lipoprotein
MTIRPLLLAGAITLALTACGDKNNDQAAAPAPTDTAPKAEPAPPPSRFRGMAVMGKDGYGITLCGDTAQKIASFTPAAQATLDAFLAGKDAKEFFVDGWGTSDAEGKPQFTQFERLAPQGQGSCDEKDLSNSLFRARGNEPGWSVDVTPQGVILTRPDVPAITFEYAPLEKTPTGGRHFAAENSDGKLDFTLAPGQCSDGMSDVVYGWNATATFGEQTLKGCGFAGLVAE